MTTFYTDRSRQIAHQSCPRARYLEYGWGGTGIRKVRATIPLATGTWTHEGLADLMVQVMELERASGGDPNAWQRVDVERAVKVAITGYKAEVKARGLDIELGEDGAYVADEQIALVEAMLRAYAKHGLGELMEQYRVLEVERDECWPDFVTLANGDTMTMQARADGLLQERSSGDLYILSFKTAAGWDHRKDADARHDVQGLSEAAVCERRLQNAWRGMRAADGSVPYPTDDLLQSLGVDRELHKRLAEMVDLPRIMGIQMVHLIKGRREQQGDGGPYVTQSHLLRGWYQDGVTERKYAWRFKWEGPDTWPDTGRLRGHTLGKGWTKFDVWSSEEVGGVAGWIEMLASGAVQEEAGNALETTYVQPLPYFRQDKDIQSWIRQTKGQEARVIKTMIDAEIVRASGPEYLEAFLDDNVIQHKRSCDFPSKCQFQEVCYGDPSMLIAPFSTGLYQPRVPHHQGEMSTQATQLANNHNVVQEAATGELG